MVFLVAGLRVTVQIGSASGSRMLFYSQVKVKEVILSGLI